MHLNYVTLFDSYYLDRGIVLAESLAKCATDYMLYIFAFDERAYQILTAQNIPNVKVLKEDLILDERLEEIKKTRTRAEYCWTCTSITISYVMNELGEDNCTYIDSDMFFWSDPRVLVDEMVNAGKNALIVPHFFKDSLRTRLLKKLYGNYCVEFNTFIGDKGREILDWWKNECLLDCFVTSPRGYYGDQKYLDLFQNKFDCVHVLKNRGGGVGPWNIGQYSLICRKGNDISFRYCIDGSEYKLIFVHYQGLFIGDKSVYLGYRTWCRNRYDKTLVDPVYNEYIKAVIDVRRRLKSVEINGNKNSDNKEIEKAKKEKAVQGNIIRTILIRILALISYPGYFRYHDTESIPLSKVVDND